MSASLRSVRPAVSRPTSHMKNGISGIVTAAMSAEERSWNQMAASAIGVDKKVATAAGRKPVRYGRKASRPLVSRLRNWATSTVRGSR